MKVRPVFLSVIVIALIGAGCASVPARKPSSMAEPVHFATADDVTIVGEYYAGPPGGPAAILVHMMPATKESWREFVPKLVARGFSVLAIDLRGHGGSVVGPKGALDYRTFTDAEHQASIRDVEASVQWLMETHGVSESRIALVGASIGANLAIGYGAVHDATPAVVALSPGLEYRGVTTSEKVAAFGRNTALLLIASDNDGYSFMTDKHLASLAPSAELRELHGAGHGTAMFDADPALMDNLAAWIAAKVK